MEEKHQDEIYALVRAKGYGLLKADGLEDSYTLIDGDGGVMRTHLTAEGVLQWLAKLNEWIDEIRAKRQSDAGKDAQP
jgi:hypothetical protein